MYYLIYLKEKVLYFNVIGKIKGSTLPAFVASCSVPNEVGNAAL
jgi:hypothetical protein